MSIRTGKSWVLFSCQWPGCQASTWAPSEPPRRPPSSCQGRAWRYNKWRWVTFPVSSIQLRCHSWSMNKLSPSENMFEGLRLVSCHQFCNSQWQKSKDFLTIFVGGGTMGPHFLPKAIFPFPPTFKSPAQLGAKFSVSFETLSYQISNELLWMSEIIHISCYNKCFASMQLVTESSNVTHLEKI